MVKKIEAWEDANGKVHPTKHAAEKADFAWYIGSLIKSPTPVFTESQMHTLWSNRMEIADFILNGVAIQDTPKNEG